MKCDFKASFLAHTFINLYLGCYTKVRVATKINILHKGNKIKVHTKVGFKLVNLHVEYNFPLVEIGINLVVLGNEFELFSFFILMFLIISQEELKP